MINFPPWYILIMDEVLVVNKPLGVTSFDVIRDLKKKFPGEKIGHAGTLDPLASGVLICLVGKDATKRQDEFMNCDKEYEFDVLFGFETDTYDILGLVKGSCEYDEDYVKDSLFKIVPDLVGDLDQPVPAFSAVKVKGRELYRWYLDGRINEVEIPVKAVHIDSAEIKSIEIVSKEDLRLNINSLLQTVKSGFRQSLVLESWEKVLNSSKQKQFLIAKIKTTVSKGTYVRAIAYKLGKDLKIGACTLTIKRTRVGKYRLDEKALPI